MENFLEIETKTRQGVEKFYEDIKTSDNLNEIINHINSLLNLSYRYASQKNNRPNKGLKIFTEYLKIEDTREQKIKKEISNADKKSYKSYLKHFLILRKKGHSYKKISDYALKEFGIKVTGQTINNQLRELENV